MTILDGPDPLRSVRPRLAGLERLASRGLARALGPGPVKVMRPLLAALLRAPGEAQLLAYTRATVELTLQRQVIYGATLVLSIAYYDAAFGVVCWFLNFLCDVIELRWARRIQAAQRVPAGRLQREYATMIGFTTASSAAIVFFVAGTARFEGPGGHFTPLFFLLAAAIFATMNNHQVGLALVIRIVFYGAAFLYVPGVDVWLTGAELSSKLWLHFFTAVFVLFFILDCARVFLALFQENLRQVEALRAAEAKALKALALQTQFISVVSHELRSPLTSINGAIALAQSGRLPPEKTAELLSVAGRNGKRLASLVNDILDVQKLSAGEMRFTLDRVELDDLVDESIEINAHLSQDVGVTREGGRTAGAVVTADRHRLQQVLTNVISNAVKFSPKGTRVEVSTFRRGGLTGIAVRDHGRGIPPGYEEIVFGQFQQVDSSDKREKQGSGLGMNIARRIMAAIGGTIRYESEVGRGTVFFLEFPERGSGRSPGAGPGPTPP